MDHNQQPQRYTDPSQTPAHQPDGNNSFRQDFNPAPNPHSQFDQYLLGTDYPPQPQPSPKTRKMWLIWTIIAVIIITLTVGLIIFLREEGYSTSEGATIVTESQTPDETYSPIKVDKDQSQLTYGKWTGEIRYGQPHGNGTLTYTEKRLISQFDAAGTVAEPGDYIIGEFDTGQLVRGRLYRTSGEVIDIVVTPRQQ